jgi:hypothetical protein
MDKNVLRAIAGIEVYPLISFAIFFLFFLLLLAYVLLVRPAHLQAMQQLPLEAAEPDDATLQHDLEHRIIC